MRKYDSRYPFNSQRFQTNCWKRGWGWIFDLQISFQQPEVSNELLEKGLRLNIWPSILTYPCDEWKWKIGSQKIILFRHTINIWQYDNYFSHEVRAHSVGIMLPRNMHIHFFLIFWIFLQTFPTFLTFKFISSFFFFFLFCFWSCVFFSIELSHIFTFFFCPFLSLFFVLHFFLFFIWHCFFGKTRIWKKTRSKLIFRREFFKFSFFFFFF